MYDLRGSDGVIAALAIRAPGDLRRAALVNRTSYIVNGCGIGGGPVHGPNSHQIFEVFPPHEPAVNGRQSPMSNEQ